MPGLNLLPRRLSTRFADPIGRFVGRAGITPNMVSMAGFAGNAAAAWLVTREALLAAGVVFLVFSLLDMVDGAVARATNTASDFGAVFDAVLDRTSEAIVLAGCGWYFAERGEEVQAAVSYAALFGGIAVSYVRARAEVMGIELREGIFRRQERVALLAAGLLLNGLSVIIWPLAVLSNLTALQRLWLLGIALRREPIASE
jgi:CDP-diacylglycerol--glycerol-3-phosphate 3-phosphatidyltransferase